MSPKTRPRLLFAAALALLLLSGGASLLAISRLMVAQGWVMHTREVQASLGEVNTVISRAGRTRTEYVDSGDARYLEDHQRALSQVQQTMASVQQLIGDNPVQRASFIELTQLVDQRLGLMRQSVALKQAGRSSAEIQVRISHDSVSLADQMDAVLQRMQDREQKLLEIRIDQGEAWERWAAIFLGLTLVLAIGLFILHYFLLNRELRGREQAEASLRTLSARILQIQDEERRKFSRELHDSIGQYLAGVKMNLDVLAPSIPDNAKIFDCIRLLDNALTETRTISHLLHPPLLDETGFAYAAEWYVDGFSTRSGIQAKLDMPEQFDRLDPAIELAMFRVLQECLTNIHRHSGSSRAQIQVRLGPRDVTLTIRDNGKGIAPAVLKRFKNDGVHVGIGMAGMRERIRQLGGRLDIRSDSSGTVVTAVLPRTLAIVEKVG